MLTSKIQEKINDYFECDDFVLCAKDAIKYIAEDIFDALGKFTDRCSLTASLKRKIIGYFPSLEGYAPVPEPVETDTNIENQKKIL